jgi:hypothetical protein
MDRHHRIGAKPLSGEAVGLILEERVRSAGIDAEGYSGHSLRAGLAIIAEPFKWTKCADQILASVKRFCHKAQQTLCGEANFRFT